MSFTTVAYGKNLTFARNSVTFMRCCLVGYVWRRACGALWLCDA